MQYIVFWIKATYIEFNELTGVVKQIKFMDS